MLTLPDAIAKAVEPLFAALPLSAAMGQLVVKHPAGQAAALVEAIVGDPAVAAKPGLAAGLWLYVDDLDRSHGVSQEMQDATGAFWHGIMHRREGDFGNSHYWFHRAGDHPAMERVDGYEPHAFIHEVERAHRRGEAPAALVEMQRREWAALFQWCAAASDPEASASGC